MHHGRRRVHASQLGVLRLLSWRFRSPRAAGCGPYPIACSSPACWWLSSPGSRQTPTLMTSSSCGAPAPALRSPAWTTSWRNSLQPGRSPSLAVGLVAFTVAGVAVAAPWILPGFDCASDRSWGRSSRDGRLLSPGMEMGLPRRLTDGWRRDLVNDATGPFGRWSRRPDPGLGNRAFAAVPRSASVTGRLRLAIGLLLGVSSTGWRPHRRRPVEIAISLVVPYGALSDRRGHPRPPACWPSSRRHLLSRRSTRSSRRRCACRSMRPGTRSRSC